MLRLIRLAILFVMFFLAMGLLIAIAGPETGPFEKAVLGVGLIGLTVLARPVHRIG